MCFKDSWCQKMFTKSIPFPLNYHFDLKLYAVNQHSWAQNSGRARCLSLWHLLVHHLDFSHHFVVGNLCRLKPKPFHEIPFGSMNFQEVTSEPFCEFSEGAEFWVASSACSPRGMWERLLGQNGTPRSLSRSSASSAP